MSAHPLVTFGAHTVTHRSLSQLDEHEARHEMTSSARELESRTGKEARHFAYPYGGRASANAREFELAKSEGFLSAVTTRQANIFADHSAYLHALPRIGLTSSMFQYGTRGLNLWLSGAVSCHENHFKRVITD